MGEVVAADRAVFAAQALADVESFLRARAAELVPGGKLLIEVFGGSEPGRTGDGSYDALNDAMLEALEAGLIDRASCEAYDQPICFRLLDELTAPLAAPDAPLAALFRRSGDVASFARRHTDSSAPSPSPCCGRRSPRAIPTALAARCSPAPSA